MIYTFNGVIHPAWEERAEAGAGEGRVDQWSLHCFLFLLRSLAGPGINGKQTRFLWERSVGAPTPFKAGPRGAPRPRCSVDQEDEGWYRPPGGSGLCSRLW